MEKRDWPKDGGQVNGFAIRRKKAINFDLVDRLFDLTSMHDIKFNWVKGHNGHLENERLGFLEIKALKSDKQTDDECFLGA